MTYNELYNSIVERFILVASRLLNKIKQILDEQIIKYA